jgi:hypothetical protein
MGGEGPPVSDLHWGRALRSFTKRADVPSVIDGLLEGDEDRADHPQLLLGVLQPD